MSLRDFLKKQFIDVIEWTEPGDGILAYRYPMQDMEIQNGGKLTVRESQMAAFVNEGKVADIFGPGLYTLNTNTLPILTYLQNWDKAFQSPFKSDVYYFSTRLQVNQHWGTQNPVTIRDKEFGAVRLRAFGIYSYKIADPKMFHTKVSGTRDLYQVADLEGQIRNTIVGQMSGAFANSNVSFLDMAANQMAVGQKIADLLKPMFTDLGLALDSFVVENLSLPDELQKMLDTRIGMTMIGDMNRYTQFEVAQSMPIAAANEGGGAAGIGVGLGAGMTMAQQMMGPCGPPLRRPVHRPPPRCRMRALLLAGVLLPPRRTPSSVWNAGSTFRALQSSVRNAGSHRRRFVRAGVGDRSLRLRRGGVGGPVEVVHVVLRSGRGDGVASCRRANLASVPGHGRHHRIVPACRIASRLSYFSRIPVHLFERVLLSAPARLGLLRLPGARVRRYRGERPADRAALQPESWRMSANR